MPPRLGAGAGVAILLALGAGAPPASAADFYQGKEIRLIAGFPPGNDHDLKAILPNEK